MQMARELDAILDHGEASPATSCVGANQSVSFLEQIIRPIYDTIVSVSPFISFYPITPTLIHFCTYNYCLSYE